MEKTFKDIIEEIKIFAIDNIKSGTSTNYFLNKFYYFIDELKKVDGITIDENDSMVDGITIDENDSIINFYNEEDITISFYDGGSVGRIKEIHVDFNLATNSTDFSVQKYFG